MRRLVIVLVVALLAASCSSGSHRARTQVPTATTPGRTVFVVGSGDAVGDGLDDPLRNAWPRLVYTSAFPPGSVLVNAATNDATFASALAGQVPLARDVHADTALVWLGLNDHHAGTAPAAAGVELTAIVRALHDLGVRTVLVANVPAEAGQSRPTALNAAIQRAITASGATLVDLHAVNVRTERDGDLAASPATHRVIAAGFERALRTA